jgi:sigma-B regulation protein RsbU (phosphoserine phosphatase)
MLIAQGFRGGILKPELLPGKGFMLGIDEDLPFTEQSCTFAVGDRMILFTDGLVEVEREDRALLGHEGLLRVCSELPRDAEQAADHIVETVRKFNDPMAFEDDVTLVVMDRT